MKLNVKDPNHIFIDKDRTDVLYEALGGGAAQNLLSQAPFTLTGSAIPIKFSTGKSVRLLNKNRQVDDFKKLWENPYAAPYSLCISSSPTEVMAQMAAMRLFLRAIAMTRKYNLSGIPHWHTIYGGFNDSLLDGSTNHEINFLVVDNVVPNSTNQKVEKLRDILKMYSNIPRLVVTSDMCPIDFMATYLKMPINFALYLGQKREVKEF